MEYSTGEENFYNNHFSSVDFFPSLDPRDSILPFFFFKIIIIIIIIFAVVDPPCFVQPFTSCGKAGCSLL